MLKSTALRDADVRRMLEIVARVAEAPADAAVRTAVALEGIARLVGADATFSTRFYRPGDHQKNLPYALLTHGWDERQTAGAIAVAPRDAVHFDVSDDVARHAHAGGAWPYTYARARASDELTRKRREARHDFVEVTEGDIDAIVLCPAGADGHFASLNLSRFGKSPEAFDERELRMAQMMWWALRFLHRQPIAAVEERLWGNALPRRLGQVLEGLRQGMSTKQVARRLGVSYHTAQGYVKSLYARYGVHSRGELLAMFQTPGA